MMKWTMTAGHDLEELGFIPQFLSENRPEKASEQINAAYSHGGGWSPFQGFKMNALGQLVYPEDPPLGIIAESKLRDEVIRFYEHSWVVVIQPDGSFEASRCD